MAGECGVLMERMRTVDAALGIFVQGKVTPGKTCQSHDQGGGGGPEGLRARQRRRARVGSHSPRQIAAGGERLERRIDGGGSVELLELGQLDGNGAAFAGPGRVVDGGVVCFGKLTSHYKL